MVSQFVFCTGKYGSDWDSAPLVPENVVDSLVKFTTIDAAPKGVEIPIQSEEILEYPLIYLTGHKEFMWTQIEQRNLKRLVDRGGMVFMDDHNHNIDAKFHKAAQANIQRTFGKLQKIPDNHMIYNCFFKFKDGAPETNCELNGWGDQMIHPNLWSINAGDRISLLYSNKDYSSYWNFHPERKRFDAIDYCRFGVNIIVYALTR